jgi:hypothetical protein
MVSLCVFFSTCIVLSCFPSLGDISRLESLDSGCEILLLCSVLVFRTAAIIMFPIHSSIDFTKYYKHVSSMFQWPCTDHFIL